jgi:hypothetical protein
VVDAAWYGDHLLIGRTTGAFADPTFQWGSISTATGIVDDLWTLISGTGTGFYNISVAYSLNGTAFGTYTTSSPTSAPRTDAIATSNVTDVYSFAWSTVGTSDTSFDGTIWSRHNGVALDPTAPGSVWAASPLAGTTAWKTVVGRIGYDLTDPIAPAAPRAALVKGTTLSAQRVPVRVTWTSGSDPETGVDAYQVTQSDNGNSSTVYAGSGRTLTASLAWVLSTAMAHPYTWTVTAIDGAGRASASTASTAVSARVSEQTASGYTWSSGWSTSSSSAFSGGSTKTSSTAGRSVSFKTTGRSFGWVSYLGPTRGKAKVYVDGVYKGTVSLKSTIARARVLAYVVNFATAGTHTVKIVVASGRVDVDAFVVLK